MANILKVKQAEVSMNLGNNMYPMTTWIHPVYMHSGLNFNDVVSYKIPTVCPLAHCEHGQLEVMTKLNATYL